MLSAYLQNVLLYTPKKIDVKDNLSNSRMKNTKKKKVSNKIVLCRERLVEYTSTTVGQTVGYKTDKFSIKGITIKLFYIVTIDKSIYGTAEIVM